MHKHLPTTGVTPKRKKKKKGTKSGSKQPETLAYAVSGKKMLWVEGNLEATRPTLYVDKNLRKGCAAASCSSCSPVPPSSYRNRIWSIVLRHAYLCNVMCTYKIRRHMKISSAELSARFKRNIFTQFFFQEVVEQVLNRLWGGTWRILHLYMYRLLVVPVTVPKVFGAFD